MKIAFIAPRYHTNQTSLVKYLLKSNYQVSFYIIRKGQSEDYSFLKPKLIKLNNIIKFIKLILKPKSDKFDYRYGLPSIDEIIKFKSKKYDLIIIRDPINLISLSYKGKSFLDYDNQKLAKYIIENFKVKKFKNEEEYFQHSSKLDHFIFDNISTPEFQNIRLKILNHYKQQSRIIGFITKQHEYIFENKLKICYHDSENTLEKKILILNYDLIIVNNPTNLITTKNLLNNLLSNFK